MEKEIFNNVTVEIQNPEGKSLTGREIGCKVMTDETRTRFFVSVNKTPEPADMRSIGKGELSGIALKFNNKNGKYNLNFQLTGDRLAAVGKAKLKSEVNGLIDKIYEEV